MKNFPLLPGKPLPHHAEIALTPLTGADIVVGSKGVGYLLEDNLHLDVKLTGIWTIAYGLLDFEEGLFWGSWTALRA